MTEGLTLVFDLDGPEGQSTPPLANIKDICGPNHFPEVLFTNPSAIFEPEIFGPILGRPSSSKSAEWCMTLGISVGASAAEIKKAYRKLVLKAHPDKGGDQEEFLRITEAYAGLTGTRVRAHSTSHIRIDTILHVYYFCLLSSASYGDCQPEIVGFPVRTCSGTIIAQNRERK